MTLDQESKMKNDLLRIKKKLESDVGVSSWLRLVLEITRFLLHLHLITRICLRSLIRGDPQNRKREYWRDYRLNQRYRLFVSYLPRINLDPVFGTLWMLLITCFQELEIALDHANQANEDAQKNIRRYTDQIRELQVRYSLSSKHVTSSRYHHSGDKVRIMMRRSFFCDSPIWKGAVPKRRRD